MEYCSGVLRTSASVSDLFQVESDARELSRLLWLRFGSSRTTPEISTHARYCVWIQSIGYSIEGSGRSTFTQVDQQEKLPSNQSWLLAEKTVNNEGGPKLQGEGRRPRGACYSLPSVGRPVGSSTLQPTWGTKINTLCSLGAVETTSSGCCGMQSTGPLRHLDCGILPHVLGDFAGPL